MARMEGRIIWIICNTPYVVFVNRSLPQMFFPWLYNLPMLQLFPTNRSEPTGSWQKAGLPEGRAVEDWHIQRSFHHVNAAKWRHRESLRQMHILTVNLGQSLTSTETSDFWQRTDGSRSLQEVRHWECQTETKMFKKGNFTSKSHWHIFHLPVVIFISKYQKNIDEKNWAEVSILRNHNSKILNSPSKRFHIGT